MGLSCQALLDRATCGQPPGRDGGLRKQLKVLSDFVHRFDLAKLEPNCQLVARAPGVLARVLSDPSTAHAIYLQGRSPTELMLNLDKGQWTAEWISVENGSVLKREAIVAKDGKPTSLASPAFSDGVALRLVRP